MRKLFPLIIICVFAFNAFSSVVLGDICLKNDGITMSKADETSHMDDMPCHGESKNEDKKNNNNCDGTCMCVNICQSHTNVIYFTQNMSIPLAISDNLQFKDELMSSIILSPPYKPPKTFS